MAGVAAPSIQFLYEEEARFLECYSLFVQNYLGERNLEWLERQAFDDYFDADEDVREEPPFNLILTFCEIVYRIDSHTRSPQRHINRIDIFLTSYNDLFSRFSHSEQIQDALREIRVQIENRRTVLLHRAQVENSGSDNDSDSSSDSEAPRRR